MSVALLALAASAGSADLARAQGPVQFWQKCDLDEPAGQQCDGPSGIATSPTTGHVYVADNNNSRVLEFSSWGTFRKAWGWDVVASGPGEDTSPPEDQFEVCIPERGDKCKVGSEGSGAGQFKQAIQGIAVDSLGDVYVVDRGLLSNPNLRVQKFDPTVGAEFGEGKVREAEFMLMFGGGVNETSGGNLCPRPGFPGDVCKAGSQGAGNGQFGAWAVGSFIAIDTEQTPSAADDRVYVGDQGRIQRFNSGAEFVEVVPDPEALLAGRTVKSLALAPDGDLYASLCTTCASGASALVGVHRIDAVTGNEVGKGTERLGVANPQAIATDSAGGLYVFDGTSIRKFNDAGAEVKDGEYPFDDGLDASTGLAANNVDPDDGIGLYFSNASSNDFVRAWGPAPLNWLDERPKVPPDIEASYATSVSAESAVVAAQINPHYFNDTRYYLQYGTEECSKGSCAETPAPPGALLSDDFLSEAIATADISLTGLEPNTTYHYRFVAQSEGGGPVIGVGGDEGEAGERTFHTPKLPLGLPPCPNDALRSGPGALLPDCRAYEAVSPLQKKGDAGDLTGMKRPGKTWIFPVEEAAPAGERVTYTAASAFAGAQASAPYVFQYIADRDPGSGWASQAISPPRESASFSFPEVILPSFLAFTPSLCEAFYQQADDLSLAPGAQTGYPDLYQVDLCGEDGYRALTTAPPTNLTKITGNPENFYQPTIQGFSADTSVGVFRANGALTPEADQTLQEDGIRAKNQLYVSDADGPVQLVSALPDGSASPQVSSAGEGGVQLSSNAGDNVRHAVSEDGTRAYWTTTGAFGAGRLYLRANPAEPRSALPFGNGKGTGNLEAGSEFVTGLVTAAGKGKITSGLSEITGLETTSGEFLVGQPLTSDKFPPGTKIVSCSPACGPAATALTLDAAATSGAFPKQPISSPGPAPFAVGQQVIGPGIAQNARIEAAEAGKLTLSASSTATANGVSLSAFSPCTEPAKACTVPVSELVTQGAASFKLATPDGSKAIFTAGNDLYEYDAEAGIAYQAEPATLIASGVLGVMGASEDASRVYFASSEDLGAGPNPQGESAVAGGCNLYLYEAGEPSSFAFIGTLVAEDLVASFTPLATLPNLRTSRVSPDGLHAAFSTAASLTGYDNTDISSGLADAEVYVYDAATGGEEAELLCASCNPSGARPHGATVNGAGSTTWVAALVPAWSNEMRPSRALAEDGRRLFFESYDALLPRDTNGAVDVYQWEAAGKGTCKEASASFSPPNGGCLNLISSGKDSEDSEFIDASADGRDVFFFTYAGLVPDDTTGLKDLYDARVEGGFPPTPPPSPECEGDACQSPPPAPEFQTPASSSYEGEDNVLPATKGQGCPKGKRKVTRKGKTRCVARKRKGTRQRNARRAERGRHR